MACAEPAVPVAPSEPVPPTPCEAVAVRGSVDWVWEAMECHCCAHLGAEAAGPGARLAGLLLR